MVTFPQEFQDRPPHTWNVQKSVAVPVPCSGSVKNSGFSFRVPPHHLTRLSHHLCIRDQCTCTLLNRELDTLCEYDCPLSNLMCITRIVGSMERPYNSNHPKEGEVFEKFFKREAPVLNMPSLKRLKRGIIVWHISLKTNVLKKQQLCAILVTSLSCEFVLLILTRLPDGGWEVSAWDSPQVCPTCDYQQKRSLPAPWLTLID